MTTLKRPRPVHGQSSLLSVIAGPMSRARSINANQRSNFRPEDRNPVRKRSLVDSGAQHPTQGPHWGTTRDLFAAVRGSSAVCLPFPSPLPPRPPCTRRSFSRPIPPLAAPQLHDSGETPTGNVVGSLPAPVAYICAAGRLRVRVESCVWSAVRARRAALVCGLWDV